MCILPKFEERHLATLKLNKKKVTKKVVAESVELVLPEQLLENSL